MSTHSPARATRPKSVQLAVNLIWVSVVLGVVTLLVNFFLLPDDATRAGLSFIDSQDAGGETVIGVLVALAISIAIPVLLAIFIGRGHNWARLVYTVINAFIIVFGLIGLIGAAQLGAVSLVVQIVTLAIAVATIVLLFRPDATAYFKR